MKDVEEFEFWANKINLKTFFSNEKCFYVPLYQRNYSWGNDEVNQLLQDLKEFINNDIVDNPESRKIYYMGNIVLKKMNDDKKILVDGQQRITTFFLLLKALRDVVTEKFNNEEWFDSFLLSINEMIFSSYDSSDKLEKEKIKLLNINDNDVLEIIAHKKIDELKEDKKIKNSIFYKNYYLIFNFLKKEIENEVDIGNWFDHLLRRINFVNILIMDDQDENKIFESINSKGKELSFIDLIKNYLYIYAEQVFDDNSEKEEIQRIFDNMILDYFSMEESIDFFRQIIAYYVGEFIGKKDSKKQYKLFKTIVLPYKEKNKKSINEFLKFLEKAFETYKYIKSFSKRKPDDTYEFIMREMNKSLTSTYFTLVLRNAMINANFIYENNKYKLEPTNEFKEFIFVIEEWFLKTKITYGDDCILATKIPKILIKYTKNSLTKEDFHQELSNSNSNKELEKGDKRKYELPNDSSVRIAFNENNIVNNLARHILFRINNSISKNEDNYEKIDSAQIEHIMPKKIRKMNCWRDALGEKWEEKHHFLIEKLGNLTLIDQKQYASNNCFSEFENEKNPKIINFARSSFLITKKLSELNEFGEKEIKRRTNELAEIFISLFK